MWEAVKSNDTTVRFIVVIIVLGQASRDQRQTAGGMITGLRAIHVSGAASVAERNRTWTLVQLGQIGPSQSNPLSWATPVKKEMGHFVARCPG